MTSSRTMLLAAAGCLIATAASAQTASPSFVMATYYRTDICGSPELGRT